MDESKLLEEIRRIKNNLPLENRHFKILMMETLEYIILRLMSIDRQLEHLETLQ